MPHFNHAHFDRVAREAGDTSAGRIAARTGLNRAHVSRLRRGLTEPRTGTVLKIAEAYGAPFASYYPAAQAA
jgi:transcriptional regulator with XRE-family HTH domain